MPRAFGITIFSQNALYLDMVYIIYEINILLIVQRRRENFWAPILTWKLGAYLLQIKMEAWSIKDGKLEI